MCGYWPARLGHRARPRAGDGGSETRAWSLVWPASNSDCQRLSGEQQQRVAVARAIRVGTAGAAVRRTLLSNLDAKLRRRVREEVRALQQDLSLTVVYVTHDQEEALAVSDRDHRHEHGTARIAQDGTPRSLYRKRPNSHFVADFIGDANLLPVVIERHDGDQALVRVGAVIVTLPHGVLGIPPGPAELAIRPRSGETSVLAERPAGYGRIAKAACILGDHMEYQVAMDGLAKELVRDRCKRRGAARPVPRLEL